MRRGSDYIAAIRNDGRTILLDGQPIGDVTSHPGFAGPIAVIASLYDTAADDPALAAAADGGDHSAMWLPPRTADDLARRRRVHRHWAEGSFGLMGRTPDHVAAILTAFFARREVFDRVDRRFGDRVEAFYREARDNDWFVSFAVSPPQVDRSKPAHLQPEPFLFPGVVDERADGIVIRGAQMIATSAAISDYLFLSQVTPLQPGDEDYALSVVLPLNADGLRLYPRRPYVTETTSPFDHPLSTRFDESDNMIVLHDVFVPWEHVFAYRDVGFVNAQLHETGAQILANFQALTRFVVKMEFAAGLAIELADAHGLSGIPPVQARLGGDLAAYCAALDAIVWAAQTRPRMRGTLALPDPVMIHAGISLQRRWVVDLMRALRELGGGGLIALPTADSFAAPETSPDVARYYRSATMAADDRVRLLKVMWDLVGTEFAGRQLQYEMFYATAQHIADLQVFRSFDWDAGRRHVRRSMEPTSDGRPAHGLD